jgi:uncharacterized SAM-binding protein YcdF (DUF218 family)
VRRKSREGSVPWVVIGAAVIVVLAVTGWRPALQGMGTFLVVDDGLRPVDAVVVLSGDASRERLDEAIGIVRRGLAGWIVVLTGTPPDFYDEAAAIRQYVKRRGVDPTRVVVASEVHSTLDDAQIAAQVMKEKGWKSAIVVTSPYHTRRAGWVFYRTWRRLGLSSSVHPSPDPLFDPYRWWEDDRSTEAVVLEYIKLILYGIRLGVRS